LTAAAVALPLAACGREEPDLSNGKALFTQECGTCHVLTRADTQGQTGPDLDAAFRAALAEGMNRETLEGIIHDQILNPRRNSKMPAKLVTGEDATDVAAYVGEVAGVPGAAPPKVPGGPGAQVFANNGCAGCHTLAAANAGGTTGPDLDETLPGQNAREVTEDIVTPQAEIVRGFPDVMPGNYEELIPPDQLKQLVAYLISSAGSGGGGGGSGGGGN
jgi:mono/diheme cytochrome c family protein